MGRGVVAARWCSEDTRSVQAPGIVTGSHVLLLSPAGTEVGSSSAPCWLHFTGETLNSESSSGRRSTRPNREGTGLGSDLWSWF